MLIGTFSLEQMIDAGRITSLMVLFVIGGSVWESVVVPTLETAVCNDFFATTDTPMLMDSPCKSDEVQARLSNLHGWFEQISAIQGASIRSR